MNVQNLSSVYWPTLYMKMYITYLVFTDQPCTWWCTKLLQCLLTKPVHECTIPLQCFLTNPVHECAIPKENRIYIRGKITRKKCKTAILLYYFHTAGVFMLYNLLGPGISFYRKSKIIVKRKPNYGFIIDQWSFHIDSMPSTLQTMIFR